MRNRVFLGPLEISGIYRSLEFGMREKGVPADFVQLVAHRSQYERSTAVRQTSRVALLLSHRRQSSLGTRRVIFSILYIIWRLIIIPIVLIRYKIFYFSWGESLLPRGLDLPILRVLNKKVIMIIGHGSESRPPYLCSMSLDGTKTNLKTYADLKKETKKLSKHIRFIERWSDVRVCLPTTSHFLTKPYVNFMKLGIPIIEVGQPKRELVETGAHSAQKIRFLHAPSNFAVKGTFIIRETLEKIAANNSQVEYLEISNKSNSEVLRAMSDVDLVIDQIYSDIPIAMIGVEAGKLGVPSLIAGSNLEIWNEYLDEEELPPTIICRPNELESTISRFILNPQEFSDLGPKIKNFLNTQWSLHQIAERYLTLASDKIPLNWFLDPTDCAYVSGGGIPEEVAISQIKSLVHLFGEDSLCWNLPDEIRALIEL